tara:strand:- start:38 stop:388 length:351 start_codon:yes stop_codon:yes gene_type:complete
MRPEDADNKRRMDALEKGKTILRKRYRNPKMQEKGLAQNVDDELGDPKPITKDRRDSAVKALQKMLRMRESGMHRFEIGGPKEDLERISKELTGASAMHKKQSGRVKSIAKKMKDD